MVNKPLVFVSYARTDHAPVSRVVEELRNLGVETWIDSEKLLAGDSWQRSISDALQRSSVLLFFITPISVRNEWVLDELEMAFASGIRILPVLLNATQASTMPERLRAIQWLDASRFPPRSAAKLIAVEIERALYDRPDETTTDELQDSQRERLAKALAAQSKGIEAKPEEKDPNSVFVVHGHDEDLLGEVVEFVEGMGIKTIVMRDVGAAARSLIDKFFEIGGAAQFAIVLLSADDVGASRIQFEELDVGDRSLKYRSRQNVILELGYFYGLLGWENVFVLEKTPSRKFPDFERPSDLSGVLFDRFDIAGKWKKKIVQRLESHGFNLKILEQLSS